MKSWKTSSMGWGIIATVLSPAIAALTDADPTTVPDWNVIVPQLMAGIAAICSRDKNVTSEQQLGTQKPNADAP